MQHVDAAEFFPRGGDHGSEHFLLGDIGLECHAWAVLARHRHRLFTISSFNHRLMRRKVALEYLAQVSALGHIVFGNQDGHDVCDDSSNDSRLVNVACHTSASGTHATRSWLAH